MPPKISIVTISFNQAEFLERAINSVTKQGYPNLEYIVVDPGSSDGSRELIERHRAAISACCLDPDKGPSDGLNKGFSLSSGDILGYVNADDALLPGSLSYVADFFSQNADVDVVAGGIRIIDAKDRPSLRGRAADQFSLRAYAAGICTVTQQATFFRRRAYEAAGGFNVLNRVCWDGELLVDMALHGMKFARTNRTLADFRLYGANITGSRGYLEKLEKEHDRIRDKLRNQGVPVATGFALKLMRIAYKLNAARHLRYLWAAHQPSARNSLIQP
jgi:glycosyltransferase involved in cell wall biosynthesis